MGWEEGNLGVVVDCFLEEEHKGRSEGEGGFGQTLEEGER